MIKKLRTFYSNEHEYNYYLNIGQNKL